METFFQNMTPDEGSPERLWRDLRILIRDVEDLGQAGGRNWTAQTRQELQAALEGVKTQGRRIREQTAHQTRAMDRTIRKNPYPFLLVAFGAGLLIGLLADRG